MTHGSRLHDDSKKLKQRTYHGILKLRAVVGPDNLRGSPTHAQRRESLSDTLCGMLAERHDFSPLGERIHDDKHTVVSASSIHSMLQGVQYHLTPRPAGYRCSRRWHAVRYAGGAA